MTHMDDSRLLAYLDGELPGDGESRVDEHLRECGECRDRYEAVQARSRLFSRAVARLDVAPPPRQWSDLRTAIDDPVDAPRAGGGRPRPGRLAPFLKAAAVLLVMTGVASAIPGSPVDDWIGAAVERVASWIGGDEVETTAPAVTVEEAESTAGVTVALDAGEIRITLEEVPPGTPVRVSLVASDQATVQAAGARYRTAPGRIEAIGASGDGIRVSIPRMAAAATVLVNGETAVVLAEEGLRVLLERAGRPDTAVTFPAPTP